MPNIVPPRPIIGDVIDEEWGQGIHDTIEGMPDVQYGRVSVQPLQAGVSHVLTFPRPFTGIPFVFVTPNAGLGEKATAYVQSVSATGCTINFVQTGTYTGSARTIDWQAVGTFA